MINGWHWLTKPPLPYTWGFLGRVFLKAIAFFILFNALFAVLRPLPALGTASVYGWLVPYRERLPYGETPLANNLSLNNLEAMFATHALSRPKASDEFRVILLGDSATWGIQLENADTTSGKLNALNAVLSDGRRVVAYNVGHPIMSVTKDLLLLEYAKRYQPDLVIWLVTLESLPKGEQLAPPIVQNNAERVRELITRYGLLSSGDDTRFVTPTLLDETFFGQRRPLADWFRLQWYGFAWANTSIDQVYPPYDRPSNDFGEDVTWYTFETPQSITRDDIALDVLDAGRELLGDVPLVIANEPIFIADGENSDLRYNFWYPQWVYNGYLDVMRSESTSEGWAYLDVWNIIAKGEFTDSPVHLSPKGSQALAEALADYVLDTFSITVVQHR